ncbi:MAG TPA: DUF748 domain-containing protein [Burkholderiales bacterium]|nr:DUF748 domain-containing protein [Burkholderiales bacterium]
MRRPDLRKWSRRTLITVALVAAALLTIRATLPIAAQHYANKIINETPNLQGQVGDIDLHLWRGASSVYGIEINLVQGDKTVPLISVDAVHSSIEWRQLLNGALVGEIALRRPQFNIVAGAEKEGAESSQQLAERMRDLMPLNINRFSVADGSLHFRNLSVTPEVDVYVDQIGLLATNLTNSEKVSDTLAANVEGRGRVMQSGELTLAMKLDPLALYPTFNLAVELKDLRLPELNEFLKYYMAVVARDGTFSMFTESTATEGSFRGYVKPVVKDLDILRLKPEKKSIGEVVKGFFAKILEAVFENKSKQQLATKIEFSGTFENPKVSVWSAISNLLRNAFVQALDPSLEGSVAPAEAAKAKNK